MAKIVPQYHQYRNTHDFLFEMARQRHEADDLIDFAPIFPIMSAEIPDRATWTLETKSNGRSEFVWEYCEYTNTSHVIETTQHGKQLLLSWLEFPNYFPITFQTMEEVLS